MSAVKNESPYKSRLIACLNNCSDNFKKQNPRMNHVSMRNKYFIKVTGINFVHTKSLNSIMNVWTILEPSL